ncbi:hypothetical protein CALVIDRAFT_541514 [Calocera viscosa TUFC12733]|uniref:Uncharacterized protein n=1 Tax=Calocera viscosa (strain TUFC12733) TaxID=1330018 RepID=A0A167HLQ3_CALVF|nr:hypothetical protein CALVIDRAFT_541514 [Calocera viscosa TUFC12733]
MEAEKKPADADMADRGRLTGGESRSGRARPFPPAPSYHPATVPPFPHLSETTWHPRINFECLLYFRHMPE